jgi:2-hydroxy-6-oxonona-2,4-dienedioate hydrolase
LSQPKNHSLEYTIKEEGEFRYYEAGEGPVLLLLHGLFGALSNFQFVIDRFSKHMKVSIPILPLYTMPIQQTTVIGLKEYIERFIAHKGYTNVILLGNSLGGHVSLLYAIEHQPNIKAIVLTGSSGLFENSLGDSYPRKSDYDFVKDKTEFTFYDPKTATKELVDEVYEIVNNRDKVLRIVSLAKSALRHNLREFLPDIHVPALLVWGKNDNITPAFVGEEFHKLMSGSKLHIIDQCGHAAMMEKPEEFNLILDNFLKQMNVIAAA